MALTLKTTGIATNLLTCLAVDDDNTTIKEFVNATVNTNKTIHANVTRGTSTWKGVSRGFFQTYGTATTPECVEFPATPSGSRPVWNVTGVAGSPPGDGGAIFMAVAGASAPTSTAQGWVMEDSGGSVLNRTTITGAGYIKLYGAGGGTRAGTTQDVPIDGTTKWSTLCNYSTFDSPGWWIYFGLESAANLTLDTSGNDAGSANNITFTGVGGWAGFGTGPAKFHIVATFNRTLNETERESLHDDWFNTLFDAGTTETLMGMQCL